MKYVPRLVLGFFMALSVACLSSQTTAKEDDKSLIIPNKVTELIKIDLLPGTGEAVTQDTPVTVHYSGWLFNHKGKDHKGEKFDSSIDRQQPFQFRVGSGMVIKGWDEGLKGMKTGGKRRLFIPSNMAYGEKPMGPIPGGATLVFDVELLKIKKPSNN